MHQPRPYGRFAGQVELSEADAAAVESLARSLTNFKSASELDNMKMVRDLPSGRQAIAVDMGGTFRILIAEKHETPEFKAEGLAATNIPMLFSGAILKAIVNGKEEEGVRIRLSNQTRRRIVGYDPNASLPNEEVELQRFVIKNGPKFGYFTPRITGVMIFTQYNRHRPSWYSGAMAAVIQVVGGYGKQVLAELPEDEIEQATMALPEKYMRKIREELTNTRLPGYTGFPNEDGQFQYDYKFSQSHIVSYDSANKPWLVQIDAAGVYAMPLPIIPATATKHFREYVEDVGDEELIAILDRFGGMPSGESFPVDGRDFQSWIRAGVIIKVCDVSDFFKGSGLYSASGWSTNSRGTEAFNVCWNFNAKNLKTAYAYKMKLSLGKAENQGWIPLSWEFPDGPEGRDQKRRLDRYLSSIYRELEENRPRDLAIKYKIRRHTVSELLSLAGEGAGIDYWDGLKMDPIAVHEGNVTQVSSGPIYWGDPRPSTFGRMKFPAITAEGCESFDVTSPEYRGPAVRCDTIVFGCYVDDELQVVKYFLDDRKFQREVKSTFEEHMIVGEWERTVTEGATGLSGYFYTSNFDDRQEIPPVTTYTHITGTDLGYGNARYQTPYLFFATGSVNRARYYKHVTKTERTENFSLDVAFCVPVFSRDCILYAYKDHIGGRSESEKATRGSVADPTSYQLWTYDFVFHYMGETRNKNKGEPRPEEGEYVYVDTLIYTPEADPTGYADSGDWLGLGGGVIDVSGMLSKYTSRYSSHSATGVIVGGEPPGFQPYEWKKTYSGESTGKLGISYTLAGHKVLNKDIPELWYYTESPVGTGDLLLYFYRDAIFNAIGSIDYASISVTDQYGRRTKWGNTGLADHRSAHHFIGVINE